MNRALRATNIVFVRVKLKPTVGPRTELWYLNTQSGRQDWKSHTCRERRELKTVLLGHLSTSFELLGLESSLLTENWHLARVRWSVQFKASVLCPYSGNSPAGVKGVTQCDTLKVSLRTQQCPLQRVAEAQSPRSFLTCFIDKVPKFVVSSMLLRDTRRAPV